MRDLFRGHQSLSSGLYAAYVRPTLLRRKQFRDQAAPAFNKPLANFVIEAMSLSTSIGGSDQRVTGQDQEHQQPSESIRSAIPHASSISPATGLRCSAGRVGILRRYLNRGSDGLYPLPFVAADG